MYKLLSELVGQGANLSIPRVFIRMCKGNYNHAAVLSQLVFWSTKTSRTDGWFYKSQQELATELELSRDQVKRSVKKLSTDFGTAIKTQLKKANGVPTTHYHIDIKLLLGFYESSVISESNPLGESAQIIESRRPTQEMGEISQSITDPNHIRTTDPKDLLSSKHDDTNPPDKNSDSAKQVIQHLNAVTGSKFQCCKSNINHINGRLHDGYTVEDLCLVITQKQIEWGSDGKMAQYIRPSTLFKPSKFSGYLQAAKITELNPGRRPVTSADFDDISWAKNLGL
jgi:uncharacterized phage protein (TIGR02220 family)